MPKHDPRPATAEGAPYKDREPDDIEAVAIRICACLDEQVKVINPDPATIRIITAESGVIIDLQYRD